MVRVSVQAVTRLATPPRGPCTEQPHAAFLHYEPSLQPLHQRTSPERLELLPCEGEGLVILLFQFVDGT